MNAPAAETAGWDQPTAACADHASPGVPGLAAQGEGTGVLLALSLDGEIVATLPQAQGPVLVGRSLRCGLRWEDPAFPGVAGEVILHPLPLFRSMGGGSGKGGPEGYSVKHLAPGVPLPLGRYRLWLLPPGFSLKNRKRGRRRTPRIAGLLLAALILIPVAAGGVIAWGTKNPLLERLAPQTAPPTPSPAEVRVAVASSAEPAAASSCDAPPPPPPAPSPPAQAVAASIADDRAPAPGVSPETMKAALDLARNAFLAGDPARAGVALRPFLPLMSTEQVRESIAALEPAAYPFFRKAYMELPYQPAESKATLTTLADCGLPDLPSVAKARGLMPVRRSRP